MRRLNTELQECFNQDRCSELDKTIVGISALAHFAKVNNIEISENDKKRIQEGKISEIIDEFSMKDAPSAAAVSNPKTTSFFDRIFGKGGKS